MKKAREWVGVLLIIIGMLIGAAVWASNEHMNIKDWTAEQDFVTKEELKDIMKEHYVPKHEFVKIEQSLVDHKEQHKKLETLLEKIQTKVDCLYEERPNKSRKK